MAPKVEKKPAEKRPVAIRMMEMQLDPLQPPKFKYKRVPKASRSPLVPVVHSPPRVTKASHWKISTCISNWKNTKGYTIPLDKRFAADECGLEEVQINNNFAKLCEALYVAEQKAREAVSKRSKLQKELMLRENDRKQKELHALAQKARSERTGLLPPPACASSAMYLAQKARSERTGATDEQLDWCFGKAL